MNKIGKAGAAALVIGGVAGVVAWKTWKTYPHVAGALAYFAASWAVAGGVAIAAGGTAKAATS